VIELDGLHVSRRLARTVRSNKFRTTVNTCFERVMRACSEDRDGGSWITEDMIAGYTRLHKLGHAHSVEVWLSNELVGGTYGVAIGGMFAAESMFHWVSDASKVALVALVDRLKSRGFTLCDVQMTTAHTERMGAKTISRDLFLACLRHAVERGDTSFS
jgi:leucyl/phenylalanyl-tRNA--protein transferase